MNYEQLEHLFHSYLARSRGSGYRVEVSDAAPDLSRIDIRVTFLAGRSYCCAEPGCHFSLAGLRKVAQEQGIMLPSTLRLHFHGVVEERAILRSSGGASPRYEYDEVL